MNRWCMLLPTRGFVISRTPGWRIWRPLKRYARSALLVRMPMISEASDVVCLADISLNSELDTIRALSDAALAQGRVQQRDRKSVV